MFGLVFSGKTNAKSFGLWPRRAPRGAGVTPHQRHRERCGWRCLQDRIHAVYVDKLDGLVDAAFFDKMSNQWREEQNCCQREIDRHQSAEQSYMDEGVQILELARNA